MAAQRPARPDVNEAAPFPADVRGMNFYALMDSLYRRYGEPGQEPSLRTEPAMRWHCSNPTPALLFRAAT